MSDAGEFKMEAYRISAHRVADGLLMEQYLVQASDERDARRQCQLRLTVGEVEWAVEKLTATPARCSCDESLDLRAKLKAAEGRADQYNEDADELHRAAVELRARLREAAAVIGDLLASMAASGVDYSIRKAARAFLAAYAKRGGA